MKPATGDLPKLDQASLLIDCRKEVENGFFVEDRKVLILIYHDGT